MIKLSILVAVFLIAAGIASTGVNTSFAQNNALSQSGNSEAEQSIEQSQESEQNAQCVSGDVTLLSCNNVALQAQANGEIPKPGPEFPRVICHSPESGGQEETLIVQNQQQYDAHINNPAPGHENDHDGPCLTDPEPPRT